MHKSRWADPQPQSPPPAENPAPPEKKEHEQIVAAQQPVPVAEAGPTGNISTDAPENTTVPPPDVSSAEAFAQTGAQHDALFDDIVPAEESMRLRSDDDLFEDDFTPMSEPIIESTPAAPTAEVTPPRPTPSTQSTRTRGEGQHTRGRGANRGSRGRGAHTNSNSDQQPHSDRAHPHPRNGDPRDTATNGATNHATSTPPATTTSTTTATPSTPSIAPENAPTGPRKETVPAVRGDRQATGGVPRTKLTEAELAQKLATMGVKNASLAAAHARAEADAASFAARETQAARAAEERRREERRDRAQMMGERERNRARKLKGMEGREWDKEKEGDEGGRRDKKGGFAGDQKDYSDGREYLYRESRGGKGGSGGGRGSGRGGNQNRSAPQDAPKKEDFPALPGKGTDGDAADKLKLSSEAGGSKSWAEQMEST